MNQDTRIMDALHNDSLQRMQHHADPLGDRTIATILGPWAQDVAPAPDAPQMQQIARVNQLFAQWTDNASLESWTAPADLLGTEAAQALTRYVQEAQALPSWADRRKIERAEQLFMERGALSCILLFCSSLPECYVIPDLSAVLHQAGQLEQHTEARIRSTAAMIFPVMMHGGLSTGKGAGIAQALKVRLIHSTIRNLILRGAPPGTDVPAPLLTADHPLAGIASAQGHASMYAALFSLGWNVKAQGLPCNQEEQAYTLLTFSYVFLRSLRRLGIGLDRADEEAYLHAWNVVGHLIGIEQALMAHTMEEATVLFERMQARGRAEPVTPDPRPALGAALMNAMATSIPWKIVQPFPPMMTRLLCGHATATDLGLTAPAPWASRLLFWGTLGLARAIDSVMRIAFRNFSITRMLTRILGYHFMSRVLMSQTRPLQLPNELLQQVDSVVHDWSDDPQAPAWLNRIEDRFTTSGSWSPQLSQRLATVESPGSR